MYAKIDAEIWYDDKLRSFHEDARWLFHYLLTSPHRNSIGFYRLPLNYAIDDIQWPLNRFEAAFKILIENELIFWDEEKGIVLIKNFLKWDPPKGPKQISGAISVFLKIPDTKLIAKFAEITQNHSNNALFQEIQKRLDTVSIQYPNTIEGISIQYRNCIDSNNNNNINNNIKNNITYHITEPEKPTEEKNEKISTKKVRELLDKYHEILPMLPKIQILSSAAIVNAKVLLAEFGEEFIINTFKDITTQKWLHGGNNNDTGWAPDFGWLMVKDNFAKVVNGVYKRLSQKSEKPQTKYERDMAALDAMINAGTEQEEIIDLGVINND